MTGNNAQRWKFRIPRGSYLHAKIKRYQIQTEGSYLRGYGGMTEQTKKQNNIDIMPRQI
jgi:hypothetical protein